jgi:8-oxo-dGTP pyrophosphatase MutT (NUDIX family)
MNREFSAGGAVYKEEGGLVLWLVRRNKPNELYPDENRWTLPRGWIEKGESAEDTAVREVKEEGWTEAEIIKKITDSKFVYTPKGKEKTFKVITYYLMKYSGDSNQRGEIEETAEVVWLPYEEARKRLVFSGEKKVLDMAVRELSLVISH